jgi:HEAT repeat protein
LLEVLQSREHAAPIRRQAAIALGLRRPANPAVLDALTRAVLDSEQPVRLGALTALMSLAGAGDGEREPLDLVLDALAGHLDVPAPAERETDREQKETYSQVVEFRQELPTEPRVEAPPQQPEVVPEDAGGMAAVSAPEEEIPLPESPDGTPDLPPRKAAQSTLDAIAADNVVAALLLDEGEDDTPAVDRNDSAVKPFFDVIEENEQVAKKLFPDRGVSVEVDVRRLSARILAGSDAPRVVDALLQILNDDDEEVRKAAAFSLESIAARDTSSPALLNATGALIARLSIGDSGARAACARALSHMKNRAALGPLLEALEMGGTDLRIAAASALGELTLNGADLVDAGHMVPVDEPIQTVAAALVDRLQDPEPGVRVAVAEALAQLSTKAALDGTRLPAIQGLIDAAYLGEGQQARAMGRALRAFGAATAEQALLSHLTACKNSGERRFAIEMLDELLRPEGAQPV